MKFVYITTLTYPSRFANRLQVMKMAEAFSHLVDMRLLISALKDNANAILTSYHVQRPFPVEQLGTSRLWPRSLWMALRVAKRIRQEQKNTIFYIRELPLAFWLTLLSKRFRDNFFYEAQSLEKFSSIFYTIVFSCVRGVITSSIKKGDVLKQKFGLSSETVIVFRNAVDTKEFDCLPSSEIAKVTLQLPTKKPLIVYAGTLTTNYGTAAIIEAAKQLGDTVIFVLIGNGDDIPPLPNIIRKKRIPHNEIPQYLAAADVVIAPYSEKNYFIKYYSVPIKIAEYMASGKPMIVSDLPSIRELVDESVAIFTKPDDGADLAQKIQWVINNQKEVAIKAKRAKEMVQEFTWDKRANTILSFIAKNMLK